MELHLSLGHHPDPEVAVGALANNGSYFRTCWGPLIGPFSVDVTDVVMRHVRQGPVETSVDAFSSEIIPEPADLAVRSFTTLRTLRELGDNNLGSFRMSPTSADFVVFRQVPLVGATDLARLTDHELGAHALALVEVNERRARAGGPPVLPPSWVTERLDRSRTAAEVRTVEPDPALTAQLGQIGSAPVTPQALSL